jgi:hypothetical protein
LLPSILKTVNSRPQRKHLKLLNKDLDDIYQSGIKEKEYLTTLESLRKRIGDYNTAGKVTDSHFNILKRNGLLKRT